MKKILLLSCAILLVILVSPLTHGALVGPNNAPLINQRTAVPQYGTGDQSNNQGCGPSCAASCIAETTANGHTGAALANDASAIGTLAGTQGPNGAKPGTFDNKLKDAIETTLDSPLYTVERYWQPNRTLILDRLKAGENIIALLQWRDGHGHFVIIQQANDTANKDGSNDITVMDPWFGQNLADKIDATNDGAGFLQADMTGETSIDPAGAWDTPRIFSVIEVSRLNFTFPTGSTNLPSAQVTDTGGYEFVITGTVTGDVVINGSSVTGTSGTVYVVSNASAYGLSNGTVIVPPGGVLTPATELGFSNFFVSDGSTLFTFVYELSGVGVGGIVVPVDKLGLLAPYIGLASTILVGAVASAVYVRRVKRRKEKQ
jgi:hypothetical protein